MNVLPFALGHQARQAHQEDVPNARPKTLNVFLCRDSADLPLSKSGVVGAFGMPIDMWVREEMPARAERIDEGALSWKVRQGVLNLRETPLLVAVDPIGDTMFNRFQIQRQLPREIDLLRRRLDVGDQPMLDELERLMAVVAEGSHRYLLFVGD